jgi:acid stress chaperone HdeA
MKALAAAAIVTATLLLNGCSVSDVVNTGGDTKCKDFVTQDENRQTQEVSKMIKDEGLSDKTGAAPTPADISAMRSTVLTYCQTVGKPDPDSKITEGSHGLNS